MAEGEQQFNLQDFLLDLNSRTRDLEGRYNLIRDRVLVINQNMIEEYKRTLVEMKVINSEIKEMKTEIFNMKEAMRHLIQEIEFFARKDDVKVLEKYINLWSPMNFTSEKEVRMIFQEEIDRLKRKEELLNGKQ
jgi:hypothetical protein